MIGAVILAHLIGDYLFQSHWMAVNKVSRWWPAIVHGVTYTLPFLFITLNPWSILIIAGTHIVIDRYRLAKHFSYIKNLIGPSSGKPRLWKDYKPQNGYPPGTPDWMSTWLMIITDNTLHILIAVVSILLIG